jgi:prophage regulatory protein
MKNKDEFNSHKPVILRQPAVEHIVGFKKSKIRALIKEGKFPAPYKIIPGAKNGISGWSAEEVYAWARERVGGER